MPTLNSGKWLSDFDTMPDALFVAGVLKCVEWFNVSSKVVALSRTGVVWSYWSLASF